MDTFRRFRPFKGGRKEASWDEADLMTSQQSQQSQPVSAEFFLVRPEVCKCTKPQSHSSVYKGQSPRFSIYSHKNKYFRHFYDAFSWLRGKKKKKNNHQLSRQNSVKSIKSHLCSYWNEIRLSFTLFWSKIKRIFSSLIKRHEFIQSPGVTACNQFSGCLLLGPC